MTLLSHVQLFATPCTTRLLHPWDFPYQNTGMGCHFLLQLIFPTQGSNLHLLCLLHYRWILYPLATTVIFLSVIKWQGSRLQMPGSKVSPFFSCLLQPATGILQCAKGTPTPRMAPERRTGSLFTLCDFDKASPWTACSGMFCVAIFYLCDWLPFQNL